MNLNEFFKDEPDKKWRYLCFRFIGRSRRLEKLKEIRCPQSVIDKEIELIQKSYEEMREGCLSEEEYKILWEHDEQTNKND